MHKKYLGLIIVFIAVASSGFAKLSVARLQPSSWYVNLKTDTVWVLAQGTGLTMAQVTTTYPGLSIGKTVPTLSAGFIAFELILAESVKTGTARVDFWEGGKVVSSMDFQLLEMPVRQQSPITAGDVIYQILPDRFANGNKQNDNVKEYVEKSDLLNPAGCHGGDLAGLVQRIPYLSKMGVTAVELTPFLESDQLMGSYDKWSATDFYKVDARLGSQAELADFVSKAKSSGIKTIATLVLNQIGRRHSLYQQKPYGQWFYPDNGQYAAPTFSAPNYDPYGSDVDKFGGTATWPDPATVSLNMDDALLQRYLTQCCVWWIAATGVDGVKLDRTYTLGLTFFQQLAKSIALEFPSVSLITDFDSSNKSAQGLWLRSVATENLNNADYPMAMVLENAFSDLNDPNEGLMMIYESLSKDYNFPNPYSSIVFADNHRLNRAFSNADKDIQQIKMMLALVFATRGIPQITYGTELLVDGQAADGLGFVRKDFPGLNDADLPNGFPGKGFSAQQNHVANYLKQLIAWRKSCEASQWGRMVHYVPQDGLYLFFRHTDKQHIMVVVNNNPQEKRRLDPSRYLLDIGNANKAVDMLTMQEYDAIDNVIVSPKSVLILELVQANASPDNVNP